MQFIELKDELKKISFNSLRADNDDYFEAVAMSADLPKLTACLSKYMGPAAWPSEEKLSPDVQKVIDDFGGIMAGQTLYFTRQADGMIFAMLWPWQDGVRITLKAGK